MTEEERIFIEGLFDNLKEDIKELRGDVKDLPCSERGERLSTLEAVQTAKDKYNDIARENKTLSIRKCLLLFAVFQLIYMAVNLWVSAR